MNTKYVCFRMERYLSHVESIFFSQVATPAIQNDLSFYRRQICQSKLPSTVGDNQEISNNDLVSSELANLMTLFFAENTPMLIVLRSATKKFIGDVS